MKLLFWNINKKDNADLVVTHMREDEVGIAVFAEFLELTFQISCKIELVVVPSRRSRRKCWCKGGTLAPV